MEIQGADPLVVGALTLLAVAAALRFLRRPARGRPLDRAAAESLWPQELLAPGSRTEPPGEMPALEVRTMTSAATGYRIVYYTVRARAPVAAALLSHGYRNCARFEFLRPRALGDAHTCWEGSVLERLVSSGVSVVMVDHMGHGQSEGLSAYFETGVDGVVDDVMQLLGESDVLCSALPTYFVGMSMGCTILARAAQRVGAGALAGLVFISPLVSMQGHALRQLGRLKMALLRAVCLLAPRAETGIKTTTRADHPLYTRELLSEPTYYRGTTRFAMAAALFDTCALLMARGGLEAVRTRALLTIHSRTDTLTEAAGSVALFERVAAPIKVCALLKGEGGTRDGELRCAVDGVELREGEAGATDGALLEPLLSLPLHHNLPREPGGEPVAEAVGAWVRAQALRLAQ